VYPTAYTLKTEQHPFLPTLARPEVKHHCVLNSLERR
jgi:hypothetical protein